jgi:hypothetical protein
MTTRVTLVSLGNRAGKLNVIKLNVGRLSALSIFVVLSRESGLANPNSRIQNQIFGTVSMAGRGRSSFTKRQKERSRQEKQREKAERKAQRKLEKPEGSDELSAEDFSAVAEQWALPDGASDEYGNE